MGIEEPVAGDLVRVDIESCEPCGLLDPAVTTQRHLLDRFGRDLDGVRLTTTHGDVVGVPVLVPG